MQILFACIKYWYLVFKRSSASLTRKNFYDHCGPIFYIYIELQHSLHLTERVYERDEGQGVYDMRDEGQGVYDMLPYWTLGLPA